MRDTSHWSAEITSGPQARAFRNPSRSKSMKQSSGEGSDTRYLSKRSKSTCGFVQVPSFFLAMPPASSDERYERRHAFKEQPKRRDLTRKCIKSTDDQRPVRAAMISIGIQIGIQNLAQSIQDPDIDTFIRKFMAEGLSLTPNSLVGDLSRRARSCG